MLNFRTDLADERRSIYRKANQLEEEINGIEAEEKKINDNMKVAKVRITNHEGEQAIGKPIGTYVTIDVKNLKIAEEEELKEAADVVSKELHDLISSFVGKQDDILVVGLGNEAVTADALGPKVVEKTEVTRHILKYIPEYAEEGTRPVSAIAPGVLGTTGIETLEILQGIVEKVKPKLLIVIDSLASRSIDRISSTIQLADTGIVPGAGVGNKRKELSKNTLGIPVIAIGIPTVVEAATIAADSIDLMLEKLENGMQEQKGSEGLEKVKEAMTQLMGEDKYGLIKEVLAPEEYNFIVTPKEIDDLIKNMSNVVARGINMAV